MSTNRKCPDVDLRAGVRPDRSLWAWVGRRGSPRLDRRRTIMGNRLDPGAPLGCDSCRTVAPHSPTDPCGRWTRPGARGVVAVGIPVSREVRSGVMAKTGSSLCWMTPYQINHEEIMTTEAPGEDFVGLPKMLRAADSSRILPGTSGVLPVGIRHELRRVSWSRSGRPRRAGVLPA